MFRHHHPVLLRKRRNYIAMIGLALLLVTWLTLPVTRTSFWILCGIYSLIPRQNGSQKD